VSVLASYIYILGYLLGYLPSRANLLVLLFLFLGVLLLYFLPLLGLLKKLHLEPTTGEFHSYWEGGELNLRSERANEKALSLPVAIFTDSIHDTNTSKNTINLSPTHKENTDMCNHRDFPGTRQENPILEYAEYRGYTPGRLILSVKTGTRRRKLPVHQLTLVPEIPYLTA